MQERKPRDGDATEDHDRFLAGRHAAALAQPVKDGSIHRARLSLGTIIPVLPTG